MRHADVIDVRARIQWTFPLAIAQIVWCDGDNVVRELHPLDKTRSFEAGEFTWRVHAKNWRWVRLAVWDVAGNGAFINPRWRDD